MRRIWTECAASFDNLQRIRRSALTERVGELGARRDEICAALQALADCRRRESSRA